LGDTDLLRALALAGVSCAVAAPPDAPARYSRLARTAVGWADPWTQPGTLLALLEGFAAAQTQRPVLFYDEDRYLLLVSRHRARLQRHFRFVMPASALVEDLVDKSRFQLLAERLGLPIPPGLLLDPRTDPAPIDLDFPLVLKPRVRREDQWPAISGGAKAVRVETASALRELWPRLAAAGVPVLVQVLIPGPETQVESYHVYVDERGDRVGEFTGRKIRTWPPAYGFSTALVTSDAADVAALGRDIIARLELRGVAKLDFKRAPDGRLYLLEVNPRFNLWHHLGARAGVNLPALVYADLVGEPRPRTGTARVGVHWCNPWHDALAARAAGIPWMKWLVWTLGAEAKRGLAWDDPLPLIGALLDRAISRVRHRLAAPPSEASRGVGGHA
jgi:predicted ATP-grasp superfamily ATP-dependent carboligase